MIRESAPHVPGLLHHCHRYNGAGSGACGGHVHGGRLFHQSHGHMWQPSKRADGPVKVNGKNGIPLHSHGHIAQQKHEAFAEASSCHLVCIQVSRTCYLWWNLIIVKPL